jgi:hypothetical protein
LPLPDRELFAVFALELFALLDDDAPALLEAPDDLEALAVLVFEVFAFCALACGLRFPALAGLDAERPEVLPRLVEPRSLTADISTSPIRFPPLDAFQNAREQVLFRGLPAAISRRTT